MKCVNDTKHETKRYREGYREDRTVKVGLIAKFDDGRAQSNCWKNERGRNWNVGAQLENPTLSICELSH